MNDAQITAKDIMREVPCSLSYAYQVIAQLPQRFKSGRADGVWRRA